MLRGMERRSTIIDVGRAAYSRALPGLSAMSGLISPWSPPTISRKCSHISPALFTVHCDIGRSGCSIAVSILAWLEEGRRSAPETRTAVELVIHDTNGIGATP
jgi:hypothetical protein